MQKSKGKVKSLALEVVKTTPTGQCLRIQSQVMNGTFIFCSLFCGSRDGVYLDGERDAVVAHNTARRIRLSKEEKERRRCEERK